MIMITNGLEPADLIQITDWSVLCMCILPILPAFSEMDSLLPNIDNILFVTFFFITKLFIKDYWFITSFYIPLNPPKSTVSSFLTFKILDMSDSLTCLSDRSRNSLILLSLSDKNCQPWDNIATVMLYDSYTPTLVASGVPQWSVIVAVAKVDEKLCNKKQLVKI